MKIFQTNAYDTKLADNIYKEKSCFVIDFSNIMSLLTHSLLTFVNLQNANVDKLLRTKI